MNSGVICEGVPLGGQSMLGRWSSIMGSSSGLWELELTNPELFKISLSGANPTPSCPAEAARNRSDALTTFISEQKFDKFEIE